MSSIEPHDKPADASPPRAQGSGQGPVIRKTPFIAYTVAAVVTVYVLMAPSTVGELVRATLIAGLITLVGYLAWTELRG